MRFLRLLLFVVIAFSFATSAASLYRRALIYRVSLAQHRIGIDLDEGSCSATAVGPHTLLTAEHCFTGGVSIHKQVEGSLHHTILTLDSGSRIVDVKYYYSDGCDHLLLITDATFKHYLNIDQSNEFDNKQFIFSLGHPGGVLDTVVSEGYFKEHETIEAVVCNKFLLPEFPGDSGAAIVNWKSHIVSIVSLSNEKSETLSLPLSFLPSQLKSIQ